MLENLHEYEITHLYAKANLLVENILEYLSLFTFFLSLETRTSSIANRTAILKIAETDRLTATLGIPKKSLKLFFNDSGQQAIITGITIAARQLDLQAINLYYFANSYYELPLACENLGITAGKHEYFRAQANIWFVDITQLATFIKTAQELPANVKAIMFDLTNSSTQETLTNLQPLIQQLRNNDILVIFANSSLKHEQLGLDKYQFGKLAFILPETMQLKSSLETRLDAISTEAAPPTISFFHNMIREVSAEEKVSSLDKRH